MHVFAPPVAIATCFQDVSAVAARAQLESGSFQPNPTNVPEDFPDEARRTLHASRSRCQPLLGVRNQAHLHKMFTFLLCPNVRMSFFVSPR